MAGFITNYLLGIETCEQISDNYIRSIIRNHPHAFLIGLQGSSLLSFNPHALSKKGLSYRTNSLPIQNQEYASLINNMLDYIETVDNEDRDTCIAYISGFLCYFSIDRITSPYILFRVWKELPSQCKSSKLACHRQEIETTIDSILLRNHSHLEPSQINFDALTFVNKREQSAIAHMLRHAFWITYQYKMPLSEISNGIRHIRRKNIYVHPNSRFKRILFRKLETTLPIVPGGQTRIYEDYLTDEHDYMNTNHTAWYVSPGSPTVQTESFEELFSLSLLNSKHLLEALDNCISWNMDREDLIHSIMHQLSY